MPSFSSESARALCIVLIILSPLSVVGLALLNTGLTRSRSAAHTITASLCLFAVAAISYATLGFAFQGTLGGPQHVVFVAGRPWGWLASGPVFLGGIRFDASLGGPIALLQMISVSLTASIALGAGADRWRLGACAASTALLAAWTYPLFAHWVWAGGWLATLGVNFGIGAGFLDAGGSSSIQALGGLNALAIAWIVGPRRGKYSQNGIPAALPGHNIVFALLGCLLATIGLMALNAASAILFYQMDVSRIALVAINTSLTCAASGLMTALVTKARLGKPDASLIANGWMGGLASGSGACAFISPFSAIVIGVVAGMLVPLAVELFEAKFRVDDPGGAISSHGVAGLWGMLALGIFPLWTSSARRPGQLLAQVIGLATLLGCILPMTYALNRLLNLVFPQRVAREGEWQGMDLEELGGGAYPDFVTRGDDR
jgi:ammonium transporter, Amt family